MNKKGGAGLITLIIILIIVGVAAVFAINWAFGSKKIEITKWEEKEYIRCEEIFEDFNKDRISTEEPGHVLVDTSYDDCEGILEEENARRTEDNQLSWNEFEKIVQSGCEELCDDAGWSDVKMGLSSCPKGGYPTCYCDGTWTHPEADWKEEKITWEEFNELFVREACQEVCDDEGFKKVNEEKSSCLRGGYPTCYCKRY